MLCVSFAEKIRSQIELCFITTIFLVRASPERSSKEIDSYSFGFFLKKV